jgi:hypothetical protein
LRFLDDAFCLAFLRHIKPDVERVAAESIDHDDQLVDRGIALAEPRLLLQ